MTDQILHTPIFMTNAEVSERFYCVYCHTPNRLMNRNSASMMICGACKQRSYKSGKTKRRSYMILSTGYLAGIIFMVIFIGMYRFFLYFILDSGSATIGILLISLLLFIFQKHSWSQHEYDLLVSTNRLPPKLIIPPRTLFSIGINRSNTMNQVIVPPTVIYQRPIEDNAPPSYQYVMNSKEKAENELEMKSTIFINRLMNAGWAKSGLRLASTYQQTLLQNGQKGSFLIFRRNFQPSVKVVDDKQKNWEILPNNVQKFIEEKAKICQPDEIYVCDGSEAENQSLIDMMLKKGIIRPLDKFDNCYLAITDPGDVARVESRTVISTKEMKDTICKPVNGYPEPPNNLGLPNLKQTVLGNWLSPEDMKKALNDRFPGSMKGRRMYVIPFSMGPAGGALSKIGIQLTDSPYVVASMRIMTRMGKNIIEILKKTDGDFIRCLHSVGAPLANKKDDVTWPCNPSKTIISHVPDNLEINSFGSGYGGNSLLGKKCFALRLGSIIANREGWLAEHMLILGITNPKGEKRYIAAAFPSACGKTNLAMMTATLPGYKVECVGDDIAWMRFDKNGQLRAINPENGFFGVAPGTSAKTNPNAMTTCEKNTIFTNVAYTKSGSIYWDGIDEKYYKNEGDIYTWKDAKWDGKTPAAHPNSRFCAPAKQCPMMDPAWESSEGVPIDAIVFGGRRPEGVPLVYESFNWEHGVFIGASMRSEATAAAEHKGKSVMHDPFAMRPFFGYNFGRYMQHWLSMNKDNRKMPKVFHVNWFRKDDAGKFMWPGFGENSRILDWIMKRVKDNDDSAVKSPIGYLPKKGTVDMSGLDEQPDMKNLFHLPKSFWMREVKEVRKYLNDNINEDVPKEIWRQLDSLEERVYDMKE
ncbi:hypothetical protein SNEBB_007097 [Seison nebaliae]|nr:hypothetical protein SNEBB_007097 [Seison nebaliae]